jgi:hypothetical protein
MYFLNLGSFISNIDSLLRQNWYTQNYVGNFFMRLLPRVARSPEENQQLIGGLAAAV